MNSWRRHPIAIVLIVSCFITIGLWSSYSYITAPYTDRYSWHHGSSSLSTWHAISSSAAASIGHCDAFHEIDGVIYYGHTKIDGADPNTFVATITARCVSYAKDKKQVYYGFADVGYSIIADADPSSFVPLYDVAGPIGYSKDKTHVYISDDLGYAMDNAPTKVAILPSADPATFEPIYDRDGYFAGYMKDNSHVFHFSGYVVIGADRTTFVVVRGIFNRAGQIVSYGYGKDLKHVFVANTLFSEADAPTFTALDGPIGEDTSYAKDKNFVYFDSGISGTGMLSVVSGADPGTFKIDPDFDVGAGALASYAHDKNHSYFNGEIVGETAH